MLRVLRPVVTNQASIRFVRFYNTTPPTPPSTPPTVPSVQKEPLSALGKHLHDSIKV
jgi:hypothetical protein